MNHPAPMTTSLTFEPETNTYRICHDWESDERLTTTVVHAVAIVTNTPPTEFDPLFESINPDALNHLFNRRGGDAQQDTSWVSFRYNGCTVQVSVTGTIEITPDEDANPITASVPHSLRDR